MSYLSRIASKAQKMPPLPTVVNKVLALTADPDYSTQELVDTIKMDQSITAHVLRRVNSAFFGLRFRAASLEQAVPHLGAQNVAEIALDGALGQYYRGNEDIWRHSMATAIVARELGRRMGDRNLATLHTGAILHDVGKLIMAEFVGDVYDEIRHMVQVDGYSYIMAEREALGLDHAQLGGVIARKWKLAPETVEIIALHHDPAKSRLAVLHTNIVCAASRIAWANNYGCEVGNAKMDMPPTTMFELRLTRRDLDGLVSQMGTVLEQSSEILDLVP